MITLGFYPNDIEKKWIEDGHLHRFRRRTGILYQKRLKDVMEDDRLMLLEQAKQVEQGLILSLSMATTTRHLNLFCQPLTNSCLQEPSVTI